MIRSHGCALDASRRSLSWVEALVIFSCLPISLDGFDLTFYSCNINRFAQKTFPIFFTLSTENMNVPPSLNNSLNAQR